ncbi:unnamed protein product [Darwinula stevensoni]|uniref:Autophagy-related protein 16 domain-containing protein n=1 Tax=Darwinula stevensoni TaxID=69355 RepID=A0A7R8X056_9CRUS|nr:unnamed protein product [Darwinula stevensoni]CAG0881309.1 unnamed protein product [Darwinula stevensoni]
MERRGKEGEGKMASTMDLVLSRSAWRETILQRLSDRNRHETLPFLDLIASYNQVYQSTDILKVENLQLKIQNDKLRGENLEYQRRGSVTCDGPPNERVQVLEQKRLQLQEEVVDLHRKMGEYSQQVLDVTARLQERDTELEHKRKRQVLAPSFILVLELEGEIDGLKREGFHLRATIEELEATNQMLKDEHQALQLAFAALEEKYRRVQRKSEEALVYGTPILPNDDRYRPHRNRNGIEIAMSPRQSMKLQMGNALSSASSPSAKVGALPSAPADPARTRKEENTELVERWMKLKSIDADRLNEENETIAKNKQQAMKKELEEAANEPKNVDLAGFQLDLPITCGILAVPSYPIASLDSHEGEVNAVKWSPSGHNLATGGSDRKIKIWEVSKVSGSCLCRGVLTGSNAAVMSLHFNSEENLLLGASNDFASRVWSFSDQRLRPAVVMKPLASRILRDVKYGTLVRYISSYALRDL